MVAQVKQLVYNELTQYKDMEANPMTAMLLSQHCTAIVEHLLSKGFRMTDEYGGLVVGVDVQAVDGRFVPYPIYETR